MVNPVPFSDWFDCSKAKRRVHISGFDTVVINDGMVDDSAPLKRSCSGTPGRGTTLGADNCPYKRILNTGR
jgi:hypothetical protein